MKNLNNRKNRGAANTPLVETKKRGNLNSNVNVVSGNSGNNPPGNSINSVSSNKK